MKKLLNDKEIDLVHRFMDFELTDSELASFQNRLETDTSFKKEVERFQKAYLLTEFIDDDGSVPPIPPRSEGSINQVTKPKSLRPILVLVLILGLLAVAGYFIIDSQSDEADERIYANVENYVDNMSNSITRGEGTNNSSPLELTIDKIEELNNGKGIHADDLKKLLEVTTDIDAQEVIYWWLVKIHLKNDDTSSAQKVLNTISDNSDYNSSRKAKEILDAL